MKSTFQAEYAAGTSMKEIFVQSLPDKPYCTNELGQSLRIRPASQAAGYAMIQQNHPLLRWWMVFDIDGEDAYTRAEDRGCPPPTFIALNRENGHGHASYLLESPVSAFETSSRRALRFYDDVESGLTHRLGADRAYSGFLSKNPLSRQWETDWQASRPYQLDTLNDCLDRTDKRPSGSPILAGLGRNSTTFEVLRKKGYQECLKFKKAGRSPAEFELMLRNTADEVNSGFQIPLSTPELRSIARSAAKWVWDKFTVERFSAIQRARVNKRWAKCPTLTATKPWEEAGISRRTWERRRKKADETQRP